MKSFNSSQAQSMAKEKQRPSFLPERKLWSQGLTLVAGVDETGRGSLVGPVVAASVIFPPDLPEAALEGVRDSKQMTHSKRLQMVEVIKRHATSIGVGAASAKEIDRMNIRRATSLAMQRALSASGLVEHVLVDGLAVPELSKDYQQTPIVKGDSISLSIAAASIVAKTLRDHLLSLLAKRYPVYGWESNAGYGSAVHRRAIEEHGSTPHHRKSFGLEQMGLFPAGHLT